MNDHHVTPESHLNRVFGEKVTPIRQPKKPRPILGDPLKGLDDADRDAINDAMAFCLV